MFETLKPEKISPNFVNEVSRLAEQRMSKLIETACDLGVEIFSLEDGEEKILEQVKQSFPQRYELIVQKLREESLSLSDLPKDILLDHMLGIDMPFTFQGKNYAVNVTSGKHTVVKNKERKFQEMESLYKQLGIDRALIIRLNKFNGVKKNFSLHLKECEWRYGKDSVILEKELWNIYKWYLKL